MVATNITGNIILVALDMVYSPLLLVQEVD